MLPRIFVAVVFSFSRRLIKRRHDATKIFYSQTEGEPEGSAANGFSFSRKQNVPASSGAVEFLPDRKKSPWALTVFTAQTLRQNQIMRLNCKEDY